MPLPRALMCWSSGKDSAWALHVTRLRKQVEIVGLLTTVNASYQRVAMHAVRVELLEQQARAVGLPLWIASIPSPCSNAEYEDVMRGVVQRARTEGISHMIFGDLFLEDVRAYRERQLDGSGLSPLFPLWQRDTRALGREMVQAGLHARLTCVDPRVVPASWAGREYADVLASDLPPGIDPCGENGEFHTFAYRGPMFAFDLEVERGEVVERDGFVFADVLPAGRQAHPPAFDT
jgi:uncharacterized protein (TIGR00290 family)